MIVVTVPVICFAVMLMFLPHQDQLKQRDQSLRKQEQEMDSLSFRNQQLAKRVELLQEELATEAKSKKGKVIIQWKYKGVAAWLGRRSIFIIAVIYQYCF